MTDKIDKKTRLVMISGDFPPRISGVGDYAYHISSTAAKMGVNVTVICTKSDGADTASLYGTLDVRPLMDKWRFAEIKNIIQVLRESDQNSVVNIQYGCLAYGRQLMINFLPLFIRMVYPHVRVVITLHGFWEQSVLFRLRALPLLRASHSVIYVDRLNKALVKKYSGLPEQRMQFIPIAGNIPPIPCTEEERALWRSELGIAKDAVVVAFFGGIIQSKGFEYLVKAIRIIHSSNSFPVVLLAIGGFVPLESNSAYQLEVENYIKKEGIFDVVIFFENVDATNVSRYLHCADLAVYPFLSGVGENSGSMLAALAHGLPTIITSGPANDSSFTKRFGVLMVPVRDSEQLADAIQKIALSPELQRAMRKKALNISETLNWPYITKKSLDFFNSFI